MHICMHEYMYVFICVCRHTHLDSCMTYEVYGHSSYVQTPIHTLIRCLNREFHQLPKHLLDGKTHVQHIDICLGIHQVFRHLSGHLSDIHICMYTCMHSSMYLCMCNIMQITQYIFGCVVVDDMITEAYQLTLGM